MLRLIVLLAALQLSTSSHAQTTDAVIADINYYADITANAALPSSRVRANDKLVAKMEAWLQGDAYDDAALSQLAYVSVQQPDDAALAVITWQLVDSNDVYRHYGYIKVAGGALHKLTSSTDHDYRDVPYQALSNDDWYGALYYNMMPTEVEGHKAYLLMGFDGHEGYEHRKVLDVLMIQDGKPIFGAPIFELPEATRRHSMAHRVLIEYSNDAAVSLNYNSDLNMITHDYLISRMGRRPGQGPTMVPDGSYIGYKWKEDRWLYVDKVYDQVSSEPPTDKSRRSSTKDLFGGEKAQRKPKKSRD